MAAVAATASLPSSVRSWRTSFLTLRDETLNSPHPVAIVRFLDQLIFSQSETLVPAVTDLPRHEVTSDVMFLLELAGMAADSKCVDDTIYMFVQLLDLVQDVSRTMSLDLSSSNWALMLNCFRKMVDIIFAKAGRTELLLGSGVVVGALKQCLEVLRYFTSAYQRKWLQTENTELLRFFLDIVECSHAELSFLASSTGHQRCVENGRKQPKCSSLWDVQATSFTLIGEVFSRMGSSLPEHAWKTTILVLKKVMDTLASRNMLVEDNEMARFYISLLQCLHLVLIDPKGPLIDHVSGFVALLRMFFIYGLSRGFQLKGPVASENEEDYSRSSGKKAEESGKLKTGVYRPPHLRKKDVLKSQQQHQGVSCSPNLGCPRVDYSSSESDYSDSDGSTKCGDNNRFAKARVASIICIQDLCRADPKSFTAQWTMLLPTADVLKSRKYEASMMTCLLFDPSIKARTVATSALATMLEAPTSFFLQVAEYKESTKCGSFTPLSSSLGQILLQLHTGILYLIQCETHGGLLTSLFKILMLLISSTPYSRMPGELLPTVISCLHTRIDQGFPCRGDQITLLGAAFNCLSSALSASSSSIKVRDVIVEELSKGGFEVERSSGLLSTLFRYSQPSNNSSVCLEALQALRAVPHNHPDLAFACWNQVSSTVYEHLRLPSLMSGVNNSGLGSVGEKTATAATKVLDETLRAISGFQGTDDIFNDKMADGPFTSDYLRAKKISSAPSFVADTGTGSKAEKEACQLGIKQWSEAIEKHMPLVLCHPSSMVRAAAVTCFAGLTASVFSSLPKEKQEFIVASSISSALKDDVSSVKSSACRAIGVITCFPSIFQSAEILGKFAHAAEVNSRDSSMMVRVTASWALANICDSLRHHVNASTDLISTSHIIGSLKECALRLTKDGDKIKANAVRALGNLARLMRFPSELSCNNYDAVTRLEREEVQNIHQKREVPNLPDNVLTEDLCSLGRMVQAFVSCVSTGNVKVQWNVCHALSNLFLNDTLKLQDMDWAPSVFSILLLLLRDSPNFKIKIQAAAALAVPVKVTDYGTSFSDVLQGVLHVVENLNSDQITPSSFKYWIALENQVTSTMLHLLGLASGTDSPQVAGFITKKASILEEWLGRLCSSVGESSSSSEVVAENISKLNQKKEVILRALQSVIKVLEIGKDSVITRKFDKLVNIIIA